MAPDGSHADSTVGGDEHPRRFNIVRAIVFDLDGTLNDWETSISLALEQMIDDVPTRHRDGLAQRFKAAVEQYALVWRNHRVVDRRYWKVNVDPVPPWKVALPDVDSDVVAALSARFQSLLMPMLYDDALPALDSLRTRLRLGVLSNSPGPTEVMSLLGIQRYFSAVVAADSAARKPDHAAFQKGCGALGVAPEETAHVGDSLSNDVEGALEAGLMSIWLDRYADSGPIPTGAYHITSLAEIPELLLSAA